MITLAWQNGHSLWQSKRLAFLGSGTVILLFLLVFSWYRPTPLTRVVRFNSWEFNPERDSRHLGLTEEQCNLAFPKLYVEPERARKFHESHGGVDRKQIKIWRGDTKFAQGQVRVLIYDGQVYVVAERHGTADRSRVLAAVSSMYRSLAALPDPSVIPNVEFTIVGEDIAIGPLAPEGRVVWAWARHVFDDMSWVMPDFDGWSYPDDAIGGYNLYRAKALAVEKPFKDKIKKALWRGSLGANGALRTRLVEAAEGQSWSDVAELSWGSRNNVLDMHEHCRYQYLIHTEGNSWSGRLRYLQNCNSISVIHNLAWIAHYYPVLEREGPHQNYIPVDRNFSNLVSQMDYYLSHESEAEALAAESTRTFRDRYLTPAAEACYWRRMFLEWRKVQNWEPSLYREERQEDGTVVLKQRGQSYERWAFRGNESFEHGIRIPQPALDDEGDDE